MCPINLLFCLAAALFAQQGPINLDFRDRGSANGWSSIREPGYSTAISGDCRRPDSRCALLRYEGRDDPRDFGWLMQTVDATDLRGKLVRYRAWLRTDDPSQARAQLCVRVSRPNGEIGFYNYSHDHPIRSRDWAEREIVGRIDNDAVSITIGLMLGGRGTAYFADQEFKSENPR